MTQIQWSGEPELGWQQRLEMIVETMREMSRQADPQAVVQAYRRRMRSVFPTDGHISLSRRDVERPWYRITRSSLWKDEVNPWTQRDQLPLLQGGLLAELIYGDEPRIINDFHVAPDDPAAEYLTGYRSLAAIPHFHDGTALNMVVHLWKESGALNPSELPQIVLISNLFGRATRNLVLSEELKVAYESLDLELKAVADIQRSLLPSQLPQIPGLDLASYYHTSRRAGGDYYDLFPLPDGRWGIFIADVSGHGTPAAVVMAITHSIAHSYPGPPAPPGKMLEFLNRRLVQSYTLDTGTFVTAFYGIFDPADRSIHYACAGHNPPRLLPFKGSIASLNSVAGLPLGIREEEEYGEARITLNAGDLVLFYTDGITEAFSREGNMFGVERLDSVLLQNPSFAAQVIGAVIQAITQFTDGHPASDDRTLLAARLL